MAIDDAYTKALLHFEGTDASTTFNDETGKVWTPSSTAQIDTAFSKFGSSSGLFDGNSDAINTPTHADWNLGAGDFTIDFWMKSTQTTQYATLVNHGAQSFRAGEWVIMTSRTVAGDLGFWAGDFSTSGPLMQTAGGLSNTGNWVHIAVVRYGDAWTLYVGGVSSAANTTETTITAKADPLYVGKDQYYGRYYNGSIDEFRFSKGIARWITGFTPPIRSYRRVNNVRLFAVD